MKYSSINNFIHSLEHNIFACNLFISKYFMVYSWKNIMENAMAVEEATLRYRIRGYHIRSFME